jgi:four helix bundle protein
MSFKFEKLKIWQRALNYANDVHILSRKFPKEEMFSLTSQFKRAADSISLNIAEGSTGQSNKQFANFLSIALRSAVETVGCLYLAKKRGYIDENEFKKLYNEVNEISKMIQSLRKTLLN